MVNEYCRVPQWETTRTLAAVAQGLEKAELVVRDAKLVNVCTGEVLPHTDVAVAAGRIAYVGESAEHCIGPDTQVIKAAGRAHPCGVLHDDPPGLCRCGGAPRHGGNLHGPPRDLQRAGRPGGGPDAGRGRLHPPEGHADHALLRAGGHRLRGHRGLHRRRGCRPVYAGRPGGGSGGDDELPRHSVRPGGASRHRGRDAEGGADGHRPLFHPRDRPGPQRLHCRRSPLLPRVHPGGRRPGQDAPGHVRHAAGGLRLEGFGGGGPGGDPP